MSLDFFKHVLVLCGLWLCVGRVQATDSLCHGTPANGYIEHAVQLPVSGKNFQAYSRVGVGLGRTYVHARVAVALRDAYVEVARTMPAKIFVYGETGFVKGGSFKPHKTHQNGLSVDFFVPVMDAKGRSVPLPTSISNRYGYDIEFDANAKYRDLQIDFDALAEHLYALDQAGRRSGARIGRAIFEPAFLPKIFATQRGSYLRKNLVFERKKVWWRHDEHYHVDFMVPCRSR